MLVTKEILNEGVKENCVPCYEQCRLLGMLYPATHSWRSKFVGKELPDEIMNKYLELKDKTTVNPKIMRRERLKAIWESGGSHYANGIPHCEPTLTSDGQNVVITEDWLRSGMVSGVGIKSVQAKVLGVNIKRSGWLQGIIGSEIPRDVADEFIRLKFAPPKTHFNKKQIGMIRKTKGE